MSYRALCFSRNESQSLPGFDQDEYVAAAGYAARTMDDVLDELGRVRTSTLALFETLADEQWSRAGVGNGAKLSVRAVAWLLAGHERHHRRVLAERYL